MSDKLKQLLDEAEQDKGGVFLQAVAVCGVCEARAGMLVPEHSYTGPMGLGSLFGGGVPEGWNRFRKRDGPPTTILLCPDCQTKLGVAEDA